MKELDDAIHAYVKEYGYLPDVIYLGRLQLQMLKYSQVNYDERSYRGIRIIVVCDEDHLNVTGTL